MEAGTEPKRHILSLPAQQDMFPQGNHGMRTSDICHDESRSTYARVGFLKQNPAFQDEEPYAFRYKADVPCPSTNMETEFRRIPICDLRGQEASASLETCGFEIRKLRSTMKYEQFADDVEIQRVYLQDIQQQMREDFGAQDMDITRVRVRRRHRDFPQSTGTPFEHHQPSTAAHIDVTADSALAKVKHCRHTTAATSLQRPFVVINVWKPLRGPLEDWPLAVCDARTVDTAVDLAEATILHTDYVNHNCQAHFGKQQRWYYLRNQQPDELMVFRQYDSAKNGNNGVPHSSFEDPDTPPTALARESVEIMVVLYFAE